MTPIGVAEAAQARASAPGVSAFVAASAGSGKTKLLTDRLLRLMLGGAEPGRIQCLTFTKAAAAEMAVRLQKRLGEWATLDDSGLDRALAKLHVPADAAMRGRARALFALVLDLPGGMRIGTIHAFCQSLLKRFPLEAKLSPHFALIDETDAAIAMTEAREAMLARAAEDDRRAALADLAGLVGVDGFGGLVSGLMADRDRLAAMVARGAEAVAAAQARVLGVQPGDDVLGRAVAWQEEGALRAALLRIAETDTAAKQAHAREVLAWLSLDLEARRARWEEWVAFFLRQDGAPRSITTAFLTKKREAVDPWIRDAIEAEMDRLLMVGDAMAAQGAARVSAALVALGLPVATGYARRKELAGKLDYEDLIGRTRGLLADPGAAWVLYKLDGGLDHLLLDEVQDTAPAQWRIAAALTQEFFAGAGASEAARTVFAVGDRKQSIYGFQGADPGAFGYWREALRGQVSAAGRDWEDVPLQVSFRSSAPVLELVDAVFADAGAAGGVVAPGEAALRHIPVRQGQAGRVELWPLAPMPEAGEADPWAAPLRNAGQMSAERRLAEGLAGWIAGQIGTALPSHGRTLRAGDVLVLVRRRNGFGPALVRALKALGVAVAGLDRMILTEQPAVADLLTLCDTLLAPEDDLSLACVLTSPLGGLSDDSLMELAAGRGRARLWDALRARAGERAEWQAARDFIGTLLGHVDYAAPHALLAEALGTLGGRARLFARLGPEAAEPVDELLNKALEFASGHPPSLQGFVHWLRQSSAEVKREAEGAGGVVRLMTVHGAKGLQAPLVILPDTTALPPDRHAVVWAETEGGAVPLWAPSKGFVSARIDGLRAAARAREMEEQNRLLYVALTRAEDRLVVCGWERRSLSDDCWYRQVQRGFARLGAGEEDFGLWAGTALVHESAQEADADREVQATASAAVSAMPGWAGAAPAWRAGAAPVEPALPEPLAPSRPEHAGLGDVPGAATPLSARDAGGNRFRRGQLLHALLQHLPALPEEARAAAAMRFLDRPGQGVQARALAEEALAVLAHPALAPLFGPAGRAEVPLTGVVSGRVIGGMVDRLAVLPDRVLFADYKTNRDAPGRAEDVPVLYLRQAAAYRAVLAAAFPGRAVEAVLVWTRTARVMPLPPALLDRHAPGAEALA